MDDLKDELDVLLGISLLAAQVLAGLGTNGVSLGKRDLPVAARGELINNLVEHASGLYVNQVKPVVENALNGKSLNKR